LLRHESGIVAIDRKTGAVKWRNAVAVPAGEGRAGYIGSLALSGGTLIGVAYDGTLSAYPAE
jgi:outer membrane protein assembly factor BamB